MNAFDHNQNELNRPTRQQEWNLLLPSKHLVERHGELQPGLGGVKIYRSPDAPEITRTPDSLTISHDGAQLVFDSHNATVKNTFDSKQINHLIQSTEQLMHQHQIQHHSQSQSHNLSIDL